MKRLKQHWSARPISWLLSVAMVWPLMLFVLSSIPANAQSTQGGPPLWAILDFENRSGYGGAEVGRTASDAFVVELSKSNRYDVLSRQETQQGLNTLGLTPPLDVIGLQRLGRDRAVAAVVTGEVAAVSFSNNPRQATASVIIRVVDSNTGELVNGALAQGRSNPRAINTNDDDALVNEAINNAAFAAVRQITQFNLPKATVLISRDQNSVVLNRGTRDGLYDGLDMVVTRNGSEVGRIHVTDAQADQSTATVTRRGLGIQPQDRATAIYQLPDYSVQGNTLTTRSDVASDGAASARKHNAFSGVTGIILAILAGALLFSLIKRGSSSGSLGGAQVGKPQAVEGRQDVLGGQGEYPGKFFKIVGASDTSAGAPVDVFVTSPLEAASPPPTRMVVRVTATTGNISISNFLEFHVYRSDFPVSLQNGGALSGSTTTALTGFGQLPIFTSTGRNSLLVFDDGADKEVPPTSKPVSLGTTSGSGSGGTSGTTSTLQQTPTVLAERSGITQFGARFQYFIEGLYIQPATDGGSTQNPGSPGNTGGSNTSGNTTSGSSSGSTSGSTSGNTTGNGGHDATYQLTGRTPTNFVTYIEPVLLTSAQVSSISKSPSTDTIINVIATPPAVTENVLELSTSVGFQNKIVLTPQQTGSTTIPPYVVSTTAPQTSPSSTHIIFYLRNNTTSGGSDLRLSTLFPNASQVFARIGTRDPLNGTSSQTNPYVYSDPVSLL